MKTHTDYDVPKVKYIGTEEVKISDLDIFPPQYPTRSSITQKSELSMLSKLEESSGLLLSNTRETILKLDEVAPHRLHNICTLGWKGFDENPKSPMGMFTDITHVLSWYAPDVAKFFLIPFGKSLSEQMKKKKTYKFRFKNKSSGGGVEKMIWNDIGKNLGSQFKTYDINLAFADDMICINEISDFYMDKVGFPLKSDGDQESFEKTYSSCLHASLILATFDVCGDFTLRNPDKGTKVFSKMSDELTKLIEDYKFCFSQMSKSNGLVH